MAKTTYAIALGSNRRHGRYGQPRSVLNAALSVLDRKGVKVVQQAKPFDTPALGPAGRRFANSAAIVKTKLSPPDLLAALKSVEQKLGRRRGRRWGPRVIDLDIILWSEGIWVSPELAIPHAEFRNRSFVLDPLAKIAPQWRDPVTGKTVRQLTVRLKAPVPVDRSRTAP